MAEIILVRHGETVWNREQKFQGFTDIDLTPLGIEQAERLGKYLSKEKINAIYSSPLQRSTKTASIVASYHSLDVITDERLSEFDQGELEGITFSEGDKKYKDFFEKWHQNPADARAPGGETFLELQNRGWNFITDIIDNHKDEAVIIVGHSMLNRAIICRVLALDLRNFGKLGQDLCAVNVIKFNDKWGIYLDRLNDTHHLDGMETGID